MRTFLLILFLNVHLLLFAQLTISPVIDEECVTEYVDGDQWIYRSINGICVGICNRFVNEDYGKYYQIGIRVENSTNESFVFDPENITAEIVTNKNKTKELNVFTDEEFQKKLRNKHNLTVGIYGFSVGFGGGSTADYINLNNMNRDLAHQREVLRQNYLKKNTVHPDASLIGYMNIQHKKGRLLNLHVAIGNLKFSYAWTLTEDSKSKSDGDPIYIND